MRRMKLCEAESIMIAVLSFFCVAFTLGKVLMHLSKEHAEQLQLACAATVLRWYPASDWVDRMVLWFYLM